MAGERVTVRLPSDLAEALRERAEAGRVTVSDVARAAVAAYLGGPSDAPSDGVSDAPSDAAAEAVRALAAQLEAKDAQIARLLDALAQAQAATREAHALEGAQVARSLGGEGGLHKPATLGDDGAGGGPHKAGMSETDTPTEGVGTIDTLAEGVAGRDAHTAGRGPLARLRARLGRSRARGR